MKTEQETLGEMIVRARKRAGFKSQTEFGLAVDMSKDQVGRIERDEMPPTVPEFVKIAEKTNAPWLLEMLVGFKIVLRSGSDAIAHAA